MAKVNSECACEPGDLDACGADDPRPCPRLPKAGHEFHKGRELSARLQDDEDDASLDCGCVLTRDDGGGAALFKCATCEAAPELLRVVGEALGFLNMLAMRYCDGDSREGTRVYQEMAPLREMLRAARSAAGAR